MNKLLILISLVSLVSAVSCHNAATRSNSELNELQVSHTQLEDEHSALSIAGNDLKERLSDGIKANNNLTIRIEVLERELSESEDEHSALSIAGNDLKERLSNEIKANNKLKTGIEVLERELSELTKLPESKPSSNVLLWSDISNKHIGETVTVRGTAFPQDRNGSVLVYFSGENKTPFYIYIPSKVASRFATPPVNFLLGREIDVTGIIAEYRGALQIKLVAPGDIVCTDGTVIAANPLAIVTQVVGERAVDRIRFLTWNIENLFDAYDDPYHSDGGMITSKAEVDYKMQKIASVLNVLNADVVALQEVENRGVLEELNDKYLKGLGYDVVLFEGNDLRGIDNALLTRLPIETVSSYRHSDYEDNKNVTRRFGRDLLRVRLGGEFGADVFVVHFKSQIGDEKSDVKREAEAQKALTILSSELARGDGYRAVIAGDFNEVLEMDGSKNQLSVKYFIDAGLEDSCAGTNKYTYNKEPYLSRIDFALCTPALASDIRKSSVIDAMTGIDLKSVSDHYPVLVEFANKTKGK